MNNFDLYERFSDEELAAELLRRFGVDTTIAHMEKTPARYVKMMTELTTPEDFEFTLFEAKSDEMVVLSPIPFYTLCAHHVVPFFGQAYIAYVPNGLIAGLSKFARVVKGIAKGFWVQEELTTAVAQYLDDKLEPLGVGVVMQAEHMCMAMRGVMQPGVVTTTSKMTGVFSDHDKTAKSEFMATIRGTRE